MKNFRLGKQETRFADLIWDNAPINSTELVKLAAEVMKWKKSTTYTMLRRLCKRGIFKNENAMVSVVLTRDEFYGCQSRKYVEDTFGGSLPKFITSFIGGKGLSAKQADELVRLINKHIIRGGLAMDKLFLSVLNMSLTGAFVIAAIILARIPLRKAPKIISYALWAVAGLRLIFPFSFESVFSLLPFKSTPVPANIGMQAVPRVDSGIPIVNNAISAMLPAATPAASANPMQIWIAIGAYIWVAGLAIMLIYSVVSIILLRRRLRGATFIRDNIYEAGNLKTPFVIGLFRPKIYIPAGLTGEELRYILLHERIHIRRHDHVIKMFAYFVLCLHWFNPLAWAAFFLMSTDMEMSCDEHVMKELGENVRNEYSMSLVRVATGQRIPNSSPLAFGEGGMKGRIKRVLNFKKPSRIIIAAAVALVAVLTVCLATNKIGVPDEPPKITIRSGSTEIFYVVGKNKWNDAIYDREDNFIAQKERIFNRDMPYIKNGAKITISFGRDKPDSIILSEIILDEHGNAKWQTDEHVKTYEVDFPPFGSTGTFTIEPNYATAFSSNSTDYATGNTIKGYKMVCSWGKNECEYAFVILGDAAITMSTEPPETATPYIKSANTISSDTLSFGTLIRTRIPLLTKKA